VGEDEPQGKANRCREYASGNPDYDPRKDSLAAIAGSVRWFVVVHTESIHPGCRPTPAPHHRESVTHRINLGPVVASRPMSGPRSILAPLAIVILMSDCGTAQSSIPANKGQTGTPLETVNSWFRSINSGDEQGARQLFANNPDQTGWISDAPRPAFTDIHCRDVKPPAGRRSPLEVPLSTAPSRRLRATGWVTRIPGTRFPLPRERIAAG